MEEIVKHAIAWACLALLIGLAFYGGSGYGYRRGYNEGAANMQGRYEAAAKMDEQIHVVTIGPGTTIRTTKPIEVACDANISSLPSGGVGPGTNGIEAVWRTGLEGTFSRAR